MSDETDEHEEAPTCRCGHTFDAKPVIPRPRYSILGQISLIVIGVTVSPKRVDYVCSRCGETIHSARDQATLREFTN